MTAKFVHLTPAQIHTQLRHGRTPAIYDSYDDPAPVFRVDLPTDGGLLGFGQHKAVIHYRENGSRKTMTVDTKDTVRIAKGTPKK